MGERTEFYEHVLGELLRDGLIRTDMSVLVSCGGSVDRDVLGGLGFRDVTITNVDDRAPAEAYAPCRWEQQDAEALTYSNESFDVAIVSAGLHHCRSPHRALLELYRVARVAVVAIEARDSALMRLVTRLGLSDEYEVSAVADQGLRAGGVENSSTPNFVYRWTEREIRKAIASNAPHVRHRIRFFHHYELPLARLSMHGSARRRAVSKVLGWLAAVLDHTLPRQANQFAFVVERPQLPGDLQPWMAMDGPDAVPDRAAISRKYRIGGHG